MHPADALLQAVVQQLYPVSESFRPSLEKMGELFDQFNFWPLLLVAALLPAVCEELAFRGFILSGFRHLGHKWRAIVYSALLFGLTHRILQQSLNAILVGLVLGYLAVQSGSILPGMVFHACHNALVIANSRLTFDMLPSSPLVRSMLAPDEQGGCVFKWPVVVGGAIVGLLVLAWFSRLASPDSPEESLEKAIARGDSAVMVS